jgi:hypothetical protein
MSQAPKQSLLGKVKNKFQRTKDRFHSKFSKSQESLIPAGSDPMGLAADPVDVRPASVPLLGSDTNLITEIEQLAEPGATGMCLLSYHRARS